MDKWYYYMIGVSVVLIGLVTAILGGYVGSLAATSVLAAAAILGAIVAYMNTSRLIEEERTPHLDILISNPTLVGDDFIWPIWVINLGRGLATDIEATSSGSNLVGESVSKSFLLQKRKELEVRNNVSIPDDAHFSLGSFHVPKSESLRLARVEVTYWNLSRRKQWRLTAKIELSNNRVPIVTERKTVLNQEK